MIDSYIIQVISANSYSWLSGPADVAFNTHNLYTPHIYYGVEPVLASDCVFLLEWGWLRNSVSPSVPQPILCANPKTFYQLRLVYGIPRINAVFVRGANQTGESHRRINGQDGNLLLVYRNHRCKSEQLGQPACGTWHFSMWWTVRALSFYILSLCIPRRFFPARSISNRFFFSSVCRIIDTR